MESLVTLLVLAIGLLGLGQLQARLWRSSGDLHRTQGAFLLAHDILETYSVAGLAEWDAPAPVVHASESYIIEIHKNDLTPPPDNLSSARLELRWLLPSGDQFLTLATTRNNGIRARDARWLLTQP